LAAKQKKNLEADQRDKLLATLRDRFEENSHRHKGIQWEKVRKKLEGHPDKLWSLHEMEESGGEPDVIGEDKKAGEYLFVDCSRESPKGRRSVCYDRKALEERKKNKPRASAVELAEAMGAVLLTEDEYRSLQELEDFDTTTSSWLLTPTDIRTRGGAMFGDYRFGAVWVYHNGADSYYAARGFRCVLRV
jgi:hypothetical protein